MKASLGWRVTFQIVFAALLFGVLLFLPAGTFRYWEGWAFLAVWFIPGILVFLYFYKHDPALVKRRMQRKEPVKAQKTIMKATYVVFVIAFLIPGSDFRFGWTREWLGAVPLWLKVASLLMVLGGTLITYWVMDVNRYAASTIQVEADQKVISTGPYKWVRHPMYFGILVMMLFAPLALASYVAWPFFALVLPVLALRLLNEEKVLRRELPGYAEYCEGTRYRLIPYIW
jgi:protein-S-isoprenylcysteine O-methyltransferase Ste14